MDCPLVYPDVLDALSRAAAQIEPFRVEIGELGVFGGANRGVLWAYPRSRAIDVDKSKDSSEPSDLSDPSEPLTQLQSHLEKEFPTCIEGRKQRQFHPHMTVSHYASISDASKAKQQIKEW